MATSFVRPRPTGDPVFSSLAEFPREGRRPVASQRRRRDCVHQNSWLARSLRSFLRSEKSVLFCVLSLPRPEKQPAVSRLAPGEALGGLQMALQGGWDPRHVL